MKMHHIAVAALALVVFSLASCAQEAPKIHPVVVAPIETQPEKEDQAVEKDPYEENPLSSVALGEEIVTQSLTGTWLMYPSGNMSDSIIISMDPSEPNRKAALQKKTGDLIATQIVLTDSQIFQIWISGMVNYSPIKHKWNSETRLEVSYTDKKTGKVTRHSLLKLSDSFLDEGAYDDASSVCGLWVDTERTGGLRFLSDGTLWVYSGEASEKRRWKDSDGNALAVMDSEGFSDTVPFAIIGSNILAYDGKTYLKAE